MYIIKIKGKAKIPDYIQLRNEDMILVDYFRADRPLDKLKKYGIKLKVYGTSGSNGFLKVFISNEKSKTKK